MQKISSNMLTKDAYIQCEYLIRIYTIRRVCVYVYLFNITIFVFEAVTLKEYENDVAVTKCLLVYTYTQGRHKPVTCNKFTLIITQHPQQQ